MFTGRRRRRRHKRRGRRRRRHKRRGSEKLIQIFRVVSSVTNQLSRIPRDVPRDKGRDKGLYPVNIFIPWDNFWFIPLRPYPHERRGTKNKRDVHDFEEEKWERRLMPLDSQPDSYCSRMTCSLSSFQNFFEAILSFIFHSSFNWLEHEDKPHQTAGGGAESETALDLADLDSSFTGRWAMTLLRCWACSWCFLTNLRSQYSSLLFLIIPIVLSCSPSFLP